MFDRVDLGAGEVDFIDDRNDDQIIINCLIQGADGLRLHPLGGIHQQQGALCRRQAARDFVGEVHVPRGIYQVEYVALAFRGLIIHANGVGFDGDAPLPLQVHAVQHLRLHLALIKGAGRLQQAVCQGGFAMVDVGDNAKIADIFHTHLTIALTMGFCCLQLQYRINLLN